VTSINQHLFPNVAAGASTPDGYLVLLRRGAATLGSIGPATSAAPTMARFSCLVARPARCRAAVSAANLKASGWQRTPTLPLTTASPARSQRW